MVTAVLFAVILSLTVFMLGTAAGQSGDQMKVFFIDLEKRGESILLIMPDGGTMLIDGGLKGSHDSLSSILYENNIDTIDVMVSTHADQDHVAGLTEVLSSSEFDVGMVLASPVEGTTATYKKFVEEVQNNGLNIRPVVAGQSIEMDPAVDILVVSPPAGGVPGAEADDTNANSVVIYVRYGVVSFLFTGDATAETETFMVMNPTDINIINGPHHGSSHSSTVQFITAFDPEVVVFSANLDNQYGHPHQDVINRYMAYDDSIKLYQTGLHGTVVIETDGTYCTLVVNQLAEPCYDTPLEEEYLPGPRVDPPTLEPEFTYSQAPAEDGVFYLTYGSVPDSWSNWETYVMDTEYFSSQAAWLNETFWLPKGLDMEVAIEICDEANAFYDRIHHRIVTCYELLEDTWNAYEGDITHGNDYLWNVVDAIFYHEVGHALIDVYDLPYTGNQEDVADQFTAYIMLEHTDGFGDDIILDVAHWFNSTYSWHGYTNEEYAGTHLLDMQRAYNFMCWVYGSDPEYYSPLVESGYLPESRAVWCTEEYEQIVYAWNLLLEPYWADTHLDKDINLLLEEVRTLQDEIELLRTIITNLEENTTHAPPAN